MPNLHRRREAGASASIPKPAIDGDGQLTNLTERLLEEILSSSLLTATTASMTNRMLHDRSAIPVRLLACYLPSLPTVFPQASFSLCMSSERNVYAGLLQEYYDRLELLRRMTEDFAKSGDSSPGLGAIGLNVLAPAWQDLATVALGAIDVLGGAVCEQVYARNEKRWLRCVDILAAASRGEWPCIAADGSVNVPFWAERRRERRVSVDVSAYFVVGNDVRKGTITDASSKGVSVFGLEGLAIGASVQLLLSPGVSIHGRVAWTNSVRAGIALDHELPPGSRLHSLINGGPAAGESQHSRQ